MHFYSFFKSNSLTYSLSFSFQMGFIQINEDFIFIEPLNRTLAVTGYAHRVYRRKRSIEEKVAENPVSHTHYCGVVTGNMLVSLNRFNVLGIFNSPPANTFS